MLAIQTLNDKMEKIAVLTDDEYHPSACKSEKAQHMIFNFKLIFFIYYFIINNLIFLKRGWDEQTLQTGEY